jgi:hypothetical protein
MKFKAISALAAVLILGSAAAWHWWPRIAPAPAPPPAVVAPLPPGAEGEPQIANPMPAGDAPGTTSAPLPALGESDQPFGSALTQLPGAETLGAVLVPENLIRHLVATIDNLPRHKLGIELRPLRATPGTLLVAGDDFRASLETGNAARYAAPMAIVRQLDLAALVRLYQRYYPLFQRAYQDLGYPRGYFNDRLVAVIDHLLATPVTSGPLELVRPKVFWEFADPELEARSAGQKLMLRVGADNGTLLRARLRELRALVAASPAAASPTTPAAAPAVTAPR